MNDKRDSFFYGIVLSDNEMDDNYKKMLKKEYDLKANELKELKMGHLFRLSDNVRFYQFDADVVAFSENTETYYHTGDFEPIAQVENKDIVALVNENCECELV